MNRSFQLGSRLVVMLAGLLLIAGAAGSSVAAQDAPAEITFRITNYTCDEDPGNVSTAAGNIPGYCSPAAGVSFSVATTDGTAVGSCTTDATGLCSLMAPNEADVIVTLDTTTLPAGIVPRENPISTTAVTEFAGAIFINLPADDEPTDPSALPTTGTGVADTQGNAGLIVGALGATILFGAVGIRVRRRTA